MRKTSLARNRKDESGQTIAIVALSLVSLFAMAALAIDVASLYSARAEAQKAADAAALAAAKAFVDSGYMTNPAALDLAKNMASSYGQAIGSQNNVAGSPPTVTVQPPDTTYPGNPQVTVQVQQTNLPIFFSRIWGVTLLKVSATATAEAYNPSNFQNPASPSPRFLATGQSIGVTPSCVKPLAIPNADNTVGGSPYIDRNTGVVQGNPIGEAFSVTSFCQPRRGGRRGPPVSCTNPVNPPTDPASIMGKYVPISPENPPATTTYNCPSCASGTQPIQQSLECCNTNVYQCGGGNTSAEVLVDYTGYTAFTPFSTMRCATESLGLPDTLTVPSDYPSNPMQITTANGPTPGNVSTSGSIMTFPIWDNSGIVRQAKIQIIGFIQVFVTAPSFSFTGSLNGTVLNVIGCGQNSPNVPVSGGGATPIPVRLIHQ